MSLTCFVVLQEYRGRANAVYTEAVSEFLKTNPTFVPTGVSPCEHALVNFDAKKKGLPEWNATGNFLTSIDWYYKTVLAGVDAKCALQ